MEAMVLAMSCKCGRASDGKEHEFSGNSWVNEYEFSGSTRRFVVREEIGVWVSAIAAPMDEISTLASDESFRSGERLWRVLFRSCSK